MGLRPIPRPTPFGAGLFGPRVAPLLISGWLSAISSRNDFGGLDRFQKHEILVVPSTSTKTFMTPEQLQTLEATIKEALDAQRRQIDGALSRLANRLEQRARRQSQLFAQLHFGKEKVPEEVTNLIANIWLD